MKTRIVSLVAALAAAALFAAPVLPAAETSETLVLSCRPENDLFRILRENNIACSRYDSPQEAVANATPGAGVLILADDYPAKTAALTPEVYEEAKKKKLRLYVEYPSFVPGIKVGEPRVHKKGPYGSNLDRIVVMSDAFGVTLKKSRIVMIQNDHFLPMEAKDPLLVAAHVAGYDYAKFGLPKEDVWPILFEHRDGGILVAATKLSHFVTGRYAPTEAWGPVWQMILGWLQPDRPAPLLRWTPAVRPSYARAETLPADAELQAIRRGVEWYARSKLFLEPSGKQGFHEGFNSKSLTIEGNHEVSTQVRTDCHGELALSLALGAAILGDDSYREIASNLNDLIYFKTQAGRGPRLDPKSPSYGLIGGDIQADSGVYYGDDSARHLLGTLGSAAVLQSDRWDKRALMEMLADFRTTGPAGFRKARIEEPELQQNGWRYYWNDPNAAWGGIRNCPHYQAYLWSVNLWLYDKTHFEPLLKRTEAGIRHMMELYPDRWDHEANRHETERCRMLLPLAWLVRVDDTPEHRQWLRIIGRYVIDAQHASGAIRQRVIHETTANEQYGTGECALIQANGDPCTDLLYATNFAFIGLHEAAAASGDPELKQAEDRLADFLVRIQIRSDAHPELDGGWYRGFDFAKWDYWGSDGDVGWGVWCIETGWTQGWITSTLALRHLKTSLWDMTAQSKIAEHFDEQRGQMLPDEAIKESDNNTVAILFDGHSLSGWEGSQEFWSVADGAIVGRNAGGSRENAFLWSKKSYGDFLLVIDVKLEPNDRNAGIQFRSTPKGRDAFGYQADVGETVWGRLYHEGGREKLDWNDRGEKAVKPGQWNRYEILAIGHYIWTAINGRLSVALHDPKGELSGRFALQIHGGPEMTVRYKPVKLVENPSVALVGMDETQLKNETKRHQP